MAFAENLSVLPSSEHLARLRLIDSAGVCVAQIDNEPGKQGSVRVYAALASKYGGAITPQAAQEGLALYAEHTLDARTNPGKHPNIDRLIDLADRGETLLVELIAQA